MTTKPRDTVTDDLDQFNFDLDSDRAPLMALEYLHEEAIETEALAHAAHLALEFMPDGTDPEQRRAAGRLYTLVSATATMADRTEKMASQLLTRLAKRFR